MNMQQFLDQSPPSSPQPEAQDPADDYEVMSWGIDESQNEDWSMVFEPLVVPSLRLEDLTVSPRKYLDSDIPSCLRESMPAELMPFSYTSPRKGRFEIDYLWYQKSKQRNLHLLLKDVQETRGKWTYLEAMYKSKCPDLGLSENHNYRDLLQFKRIEGREAERFLTGQCDLCQTSFLTLKMKNFYVLRPAVVNDRVTVSFRETNVLQICRELQKSRSTLLDICCTCCEDCFPKNFDECFTRVADLDQFDGSMKLCHSKIFTEQ